MAQVVFWVEIEEDVDIGETKVSIHQQYIIALFGKGGGEVNRNIGFADATFTTGDGNYANRLLLWRSRDG